MRSEFRETSPQDGPAIAAFLQRIFGAELGESCIAPRNLHWKSWEPHPDWVGSRSYVVCKDEAIVAHGTLVPLTLLNGKRRVKMAHLIDWAADPQSVGSGVILLKRSAQMVDAVLAIGGSEMTQKVMPALGFKTYGAVTNFARPVRPFKRLNGQALSARSAAQVARSLLWSLQAPTIPTQGWTVNRIGEEQLRSAAIAWPRGNDKVALFERSAESLAYFLRCPVVPMELYSVAKDDVIRGYFVLAYAPGQARIADFYIDSERPEDWRTVIQLAVSQAAKEPSVVEVVSVASDAVISEALSECGFHARGESALRMLPANGVDLDAASIRFQLLDNDFAYLHQNKPNYWA